MKRIVMPHGNRQKLARANKVPLRTLDDALRFVSNSPQAQALREQAKTLYGGKVVIL